MAIARKPKATKQKKQVDEKTVNALINKGGQPLKKDTEKTDTKGVLVNIPIQILEQIDDSVSSKPFKTPRHTWLLEAIYEKLEREK